MHNAIHIKEIAAVNTPNFNTTSQVPPPSLTAATLCTEITKPLLNSST